MTENSEGKFCICSNVTSTSSNKVAKENTLYIFLSTSNNSSMTFFYSSARDKSSSNCGVNYTSSANYELSLFSHDSRASVYMVALPLFTFGGGALRLLSLSYLNFSVV